LYSIEYKLQVALLFYTRTIYENYETSAATNRIKIQRITTHYI